MVNDWPKSEDPTEGEHHQGRKLQLWYDHHQVLVVFEVYEEQNRQGSVQNEANSSKQDDPGAVTLENA